MRINEFMASNAGTLLSDPALKRKLTAYKKTMAAEVLKADAELQAELEA